MLPIGKLLKISLYTIFLVLNLSLSCVFAMSILRPFLLVILEVATYNWPWLKTCLDRKRPARCNDCSWLLFIVITKQIDIGNCLIFRTKCNLESERDSTIRGMNTLSLTWVPEMIFPSKNHFDNWVTKSFVPLQSPTLWFKFWSSIIGIPTLSMSLWLGIPRNLEEF